MWLRQHCVTATGPGVSLEARRWRGRSRILLLSKASLGASGTRPITSTSYCVCFTRHTVYYLFLSLSLSLSLFHCSLTRSVLGRSTPHGTERGIGQGDSRFLVCTYRPPARLRSVFLPCKYRYGQYIGIWPEHCVQSVRATVIVSIFYFSPDRKLLHDCRAIPGKFRIEPPT